MSAADSEPDTRAAQVVGILTVGQADRPAVRYTLERYCDAMVRTFDAFAQEVRAGRRPTLRRRR